MPGIRPGMTSQMPMPGLMDRFLSHTLTTHSNLIDALSND